jgi:hypothetical protein
MDPVIFFPIPIDQLKAIIQEVVRNEIRSHQVEEVQERMMSSKETCKLFYPAISAMTLYTWTKKGYLQKHLIGGRIFYKYSEVISAMKQIKRYRGRNNEVVKSY